MKQIQKHIGQYFALCFISGWHKEKSLSFQGRVFSVMASIFYCTLNIERISATKLLSTGTLKKMLSWNLWLG